MINRKVQAVDSLVVLVDLERGIQCTVDTGFRLVRHGFFWRAEYPLHDGHTLGVDGAQVGVFEQADQV